MHSQITVGNVTLPKAVLSTVKIFAVHRKYSYLLVRIYLHIKAGMKVIWLCKTSLIFLPIDKMSHVMVILSHQIWCKNVSLPNILLGIFIRLASMK